MPRKPLAIFATLGAIVSTHSYALAGAINSGGNGANVGFVKPIQNLGNAMELLGGAAVAIAIFVLVGQNLFHREDWGSLAGKMVYLIIGGPTLQPTPAPKPSPSLLATPAPKPSPTPQLISAQDLGALDGSAFAAMVGHYVDVNGYVADVLTVADGGSPPRSPDCRVIARRRQTRLPFPGSAEHGKRDFTYVPSKHTSNTLRCGVNL